MKRSLLFASVMMLLLLLTACGHTHEFGEPVEVTPLTCTEDGVIEKTCIDCGEVVTETLTATGHNFTPATLFAPKTCTNCGLTEGEALATVVSVGDVIESENHSFTVESTEFTGSLSERRGNTTYRSGQDGYLFAVKLNFTNLATDAFERWNSDRISDISMEYSGKYQYEGEYWCPVDDIVPLASEIVYITYSVPESMSQDNTNSLWLTFTIDGVPYAMVIQEGSVPAEDSATDTATDAETSAELVSDLVVGDMRTDNENFSFVLSDVSFTTKPSEKHGNTTYNYMDGYWLVCKLEFTNLGKEKLEDWQSDRFTDMKATFADEYEYEGRLWIPLDEIVPLGTGNAYVLFEVSELVEDSTDPLIATFTIDDQTFTVDCRAAG